MLIKLNLLLLLLIVTNLMLAQESELTKLANRAQELERLSKERKEKIDELENQVKNLSKRAAGTRNEIEERNKIIQKRTEEIFVLRGKLSDLSFEYDKLFQEFELLGTKSKEQEGVIKDVEAKRSKLTRDLKDVNKKVEDLTNELSITKHDLELANAKANALEVRMNELVRKIRYVKFIELSNVSNLGPSFNFSVGNLSRGYALYSGIGAGFSIIARDTENVSINLASCYGTLKASLKSGEKLGFSFKEQGTELLERFKIYMSLKVGYSFRVQKFENSRFNTGGLMGGIDIGGLYNINEKVNPFISVGWYFQNLRNKNNIIKENKIYHGANFVIGFYF